MCVRQCYDLEMIAATAFHLVGQLPAIELEEAIMLCLECSAAKCLQQINIFRLVGCAAARYNGSIEQADKKQKDEESSA